MDELQLELTPDPLPAGTKRPIRQVATEGRATRRKRHTGKTFVYLAVVRRKGSEFVGRFKIGVAIDPRLRLKGLPEGERIDLRASTQRALPSAQRAHQVESALHKALAPMRLSPGHRDDGYTEWFDLSGLATARMLLETLPDSETGSPLRPVGNPKPLTSHYKRPRRPPTREAHDLRIWAANQRQVRRVRLVWLRLASMTPLQVHAEQGDAGGKLVLAGFRNGIVPPGHSLRMLAMGSQQIYQLRLPRPIEGEREGEGVPCALVTRVDYAGPNQQDLEIHLQRTRDLERLPDGPAIVTALKSALRTVAAMATAREEGWIASRRAQPVGREMEDFAAVVDALRVRP